MQKHRYFVLVDIDRSIDVLFTENSAHHIRVINASYKRIKQKSLISIDIV